MTDRLTNTEKIETAAAEVMKLARNKLVVSLRFMDSAINRLSLIPLTDLGILAVDGDHIIYDPIKILLLYRENDRLPARLIMHMVLHCLFGHFSPRPGTDEKAWDLACDITVESVLNDMQLGCCETGVLGIQEPIINDLRFKAGTLTAEKLYRYFLSSEVSHREINDMKDIFSMDDHMIWHESNILDGYVLSREKTSGEEESEDSISIDGGSENEERRSRLQETWKNVAEYVLIDLESFSKKQGDASGSMLQNLQAVNRERYDYEAFLKKFAVMGETVGINDDEFDYIFYTYGLNKYGKMPLVEPLEYKETKRIKEFVVAIDTSGSVSGSLVQKFVEKTYNILEQQENFFTKINLHIIQCDSAIHEDARITSRQDFEYYLSTMKLKGFGGTDFRPVFTYVDELIKKRELNNLKGLIYFTDGYGTFPDRKPEYEVAFTFVDDEYNNYDVPVWAIKLVLQSDEI